MTKANSTTRIAVCAVAAFVWVALAAEAHAQDVPASSGDVVPAVEPAPGSGSGEEQPPAAGTDDSATADPGAEGAIPGAGSGDQAPPEQPVLEQPVVEQPVVEQPVVEQPGLEQPGFEQPVLEQPGFGQPAPEPPATIHEAPSPMPSAGPLDLPVLGPPLIPEAPVWASPGGDLLEEQPLSDAAIVPMEVKTAVGSQRESIVTVRRDAFPAGLVSLFPSRVGGGLAAVTSASDRLHLKSGSQLETRRNIPSAAEPRSDGPLLPPLALGEGAPSTRYVSGGGLSGGSAGGVFAWALAGLLALFAAAQCVGGLVPLTLALPRRIAFGGFPERPD
jgi:hypothetical protein